MWLHIVLQKFLQKVCIYIQLFFCQIICLTKNGTLFIHIHYTYTSDLQLFKWNYNKVKFSQKSEIDLTYFLLEHLPRWSNIWFFKLVGLLKPRLQIWHLNGHSPLCTYMWLFRSPGVGNDFEHCEHLCGFSWKSITNILQWTYANEVIQIHLKVSILFIYWETTFLFLIDFH